jgi:hypothetical protein
MTNGVATKVENDDGKENHQRPEDCDQYSGEHLGDDETMLILFVISHFLITRMPRLNIHRYTRGVHKGRHHR